MARYLRDYRVDFVIDGKSTRTLTYTTVNNTNPLHISFACAVEKGPAKLKLKIFNLSQESRKLLQSEDIKVRLQVGFRTDNKPDVSNLQTIFIGSVDPSEPVTTTSISADHVTSISATEGYIIKEAKISIDADAGISHVQLIKRIVNRIVANSGGMISADFTELDAAGILDRYSKGTSVVGVADQVLVDRLNMHNLTYSISRGVLKIQRPGKTVRTLIHEISQDTGLLSVPKPQSMIPGRALSDPKSTKAFSFVCLLTPEIQPLERVRLSHESLESDIDLIVDRVIHSGGYEANQWYSKVDAHFEYVLDKNKLISKAQQKKNQQSINYFDIITNLPDAKFNNSND